MFTLYLSREHFLYSSIIQSLARYQTVFFITLSHKFIIIHSSQSLIMPSKPSVFSHHDMEILDYFCSPIWSCHRDPPLSRFSHHDTKIPSQFWFYVLSIITWWFMRAMILWIQLTQSPFMPRRTIFKFLIMRVAYDHTCRVRAIMIDVTIFRKPSLSDSVQYCD